MRRELCTTYCQSARLFSSNSEVHVQRRPVSQRKSFALKPCEDNIGHRSKAEERAEFLS